MRWLNDSNKLGSYPESEEFQIERVIIWVTIPAHGSRAGWLEQANRIFDEVWRAIPDVVSVARLGLGVPRTDPKTHEEVEVAGEQVTVMGIRIDPVRGSATYDVGFEYDQVGMVSRDPRGGLFVLG